MAVSSITPISISDIEQQIATVTAELEKARAQNFAAAEAAFLAAQKAVATAQAKVNELSVKAVTAAAQNRLAQVRIVLDDHEATLTATKTAFDALQLEQEAAQEFNAKVELLLAGKKLGKKIKFTKKEKAVLKADKKAAKKIAKAEKKIAKDQKEEAKKLARAESKTAKANESNKDAVADAPIAQENPVVKPAAVKKSPTKKPSVKKAPITKKVVDPIIEEKPVDTSVADVTPEPVKEESIEVAVAPQPEATSVETINTHVDTDQRSNTSIESLDQNADA